MTRSIAKQIFTELFQNPEGRFDKKVKTNFLSRLFNKLSKKRNLKISQYVRNLTLKEFEKEGILKKINNKTYEINFFSEKDQIKNLLLDLHAKVDLLLQDKNLKIEEKLSNIQEENVSSTFIQKEETIVEKNVSNTVIQKEETIVAENVSSNTFIQKEETIVEENISIKQEIPKLSEAEIRNLFEEEKEVKKFSLNDFKNEEINESLLSVIEKNQSTKKNLWSSLEERVFEGILQIYGIEYIKDFTFYVSEGCKKIDFYLTEYNIFIEIDGINSHFFHEDNIYHYFNKKERENEKLKKIDVEKNRKSDFVKMKAMENECNLFVRIQVEWFDQLRYYQKYEKFTEWKYLKNNNSLVNMYEPFFVKNKFDNKRANILSLINFFDPIIWYLMKGKFIKGETLFFLKKYWFEKGTPEELQKEDPVHVGKHHYEKYMEQVKNPRLILYDDLSNFTIENKVNNCNNYETISIDNILLSDIFDENYYNTVTNCIESALKKS